MISKLLIFYGFVLLVNFSHGCNDNGAYRATSTHKGQRYRLSCNRLSRDQAAQKCKDDFSTLAVITNSEINDVMFDLVNLSTILSDGTSPVMVGVWIGLLLSNSRDGVWENGESYNSTSFSNWSPNEPRRGGPNCVQLWGGYFWQWDDNYCDIENYFVCQDQDPTTYNIARIEEIAESILSLPTNVSVDRIVVTQLSTKVDSLLETNIETMSSNEILMVVDDITKNYNASMGDLKINRENIDIEIVSINTDNVEKSSGITLGNEISEQTESSVSVHLSEKLLSETLERNNLTTLQIGSVVYKQASLFQDNGSILVEENSLFQELGPSSRSEPIVLSHVVSIDVNDAVMDGLNSPVVMLYQFADNIMENTTQTNMTASYRKEAEIKCVFWDFERLGASWSTDGCQTIMINTSNNGTTMVNCSCDHMTHFAVILDTTFFYEPEFLTFITICGCAISIFCLLATIFTNLYFRQLRTKLPQQILIHVCLSLILLDSVFLIGIDQRNHVTFCYVTTAMLHYAVLLSWAWMLTEAVFLLRTLVLSSVGSVSGKWFIWIASLLCYLLPGGIVFAVAKLTGDNYQSDRYCWLSSNHLIYSIVIPIAVVLGINILIFLTIMYNITFRSQMFKKHLDLQRISQAIRRALCMVFVLGLPWLFGYIMLLSKDERATQVFSIIFTVFNSLQGFAIFILYCVRQENVRNLWFQPVQQKYRKTFKFLREKNTVRRFTNDTQEKQTSERVLSKLSLDSIKTTPLSSPAKLVPFHRNSPSRQNPPPLPAQPIQNISPLANNDQQLLPQFTKNSLPLPPPPISKPKPISLPQQQPYRTNQIASSINPVSSAKPFANNFKAAEISSWKENSPTDTKQPFSMKPNPGVKPFNTPVKKLSPKFKQGEQITTSRINNDIKPPTKDLQMMPNMSKLEPFPLVKPITQKHSDTQPFSVTKPNYNKKAPIPLPTSKPTKANNIITNSNQRMFLPTKKPTHI